MKPADQARGRRQFLAGLAGATGSLLLPREALRAFPDRPQIDSLRDVLNIAHLDKAASRRLSPAAYHFIVSSADDGTTARANRAAFERVRIRPRRLVNVSELDTSIELFGATLPSPILLAPAGNQAQVHDEAELATARAAAAQGHLMIAAHMSNYSIEAIRETGAKNWFQLYPSPNREFLLHVAQRAQAAGCTALVLTVDGPGRGNREAERWFAKRRNRGSNRPTMQLGNFTQFKGPKGIGDPTLDWNAVAGLREQLELPLLLKGIVTREDARMARRIGVDGVIISNHGGRQEGSGRGTLDVLPEIADELRGRIPLLIDGGIRRGADVFKALALGADAVCIGRPYLWGLGAFGQAGVEKCLQILQSEFSSTLKFAGTPTLADITPQHVWLPE